MPCRREDRSGHVWSLEGEDVFLCPSRWASGASSSELLVQGVNNNEPDTTSVSIRKSSRGRAQASPEAYSKG